MSGKRWGSDEFWGLGYEFDPQWLLTPRQLELQEKLSRGMVEPFIRVVVDATDAPDAAAVADALVPGRLPAFGLRDHAVARNFHLKELL